MLLIRLRHGLCLSEFRRDSVTREFVSRTAVIVDDCFSISRLLRILLCLVPELLLDCQN